MASLLLLQGSLVAAGPLRGGSPAIQTSPSPAAAPCSLQPRPAPPVWAVLADFLQYPPYQHLPAPSHSEVAPGHPHPMGLGPRASPSLPLAISGSIFGVSLPHPGLSPPRHPGAHANAYSTNFLIARAPQAMLSQWLYPSMPQPMAPFRGSQGAASNRGLLPTILILSGRRVLLFLSPFRPSLV